MVDEETAPIGLEGEVGRHSEGAGSLFPGHLLASQGRGKEEREGGRIKSL